MEPMDQREDEILADGLAAVARAAGGAAGGRLTGIIARKMKKNVGEIELLVPLPFEAAVARVVSVMARAGRRTEPPRAGSGADGHMVRVVAGGGVGGLNPVVVTVLVTRGGESGSHIRLRAAAKEGLIKQRSGERTARSLAEQLSM